MCVCVCVCVCAFVGVLLKQFSELKKKHIMCIVGTIFR